MNPLEICILGASGIAGLWLLYMTTFRMTASTEDRLIESLEAFSTAIELRFPSHTGLSRRTVSLSLASADILGLSVSKRRNLEAASKLKDIGLCSVPYRLLNERREEDWTPDEWTTYAQVPEVSAAMLEKIPNLHAVGQLVRLYRADFNPQGNGEEPYGVKLPIEARILRIVSDYVWLERTRGDLLARELIQEGVGTKYCPRAATGLFAVLTSGRGSEKPLASTAA
jgi:response regulator RpfG family c-di-GMP phosphodiesterase